MIITALLQTTYLFIYALTSPLRILSDVSLPAEFTNAIESVNQYLVSLDFVVPVPTLITILGITLAIEGFIFGYKAVNWLIRKIPGIN